MKKKICQIALFLLCVILPLAAVSFFFAKSGRERQLASRHVCRSFYVNMERDGNTVRVHAWKEEGGDYRIVLPSYAPLCSEVSLGEDRSRGRRILLDGREISSYEGRTYGELKDSYALTVRDQRGKTLEESRLRISCSGNLPAVFVWTSSGSMDILHASKDNREKGGIAVYTKDGAMDYAGRLGHVKGRGNITWEQEKKPYNLTLEKPESLLGMAETADWALLAGAMDASYIRNRLAFGLAEELGIEETTDASFVDLFLNGEYAGLYLLTEKVKQDETTEQGEKYLLEIEMAERLEGEPYSFRTQAGQPIVIKTDRSLPEEKLAQIRAFVQRAEDAVYSHDWDEIGRLIDMESYVRMYLAEEILQNQDAYISSQYMYFYDKNGQYSKIYSGPAWDFDSSLVRKDGMFETELTAGQSRVGYPKYWIEEMVQDDRFQEAVRKEYGRLADTYLGNGIYEAIEACQEELAAAVAADCLRWPGRTPEGWREELSALREYLGRRLAFLDELWVLEKPFHKVRIEVDSDTFSALDYLVEDGEPIVSIPAHFTRKGYRFGGWRVRETGEEFRADQPVYRDMTLEAVWTGEKAGTSAGRLGETGLLQMRYLLFAAIAAGTLLLLAYELLQDRGRRS